MAGLIRRADIDEVRSRTNIADVIGDHVTLKSAGVGSLKGLCPFHEERSPSFHVRPQVGFYHCFGCGEGGDVFTFLQRIDHVSFAEAVERLAQRIGFELHYEDGGPSVDVGNRARLLAANRAAEQWFQTQLTTSDAEPARQFLGGRGFDATAAATFGVGFAPRSFNALSRALTAQGFSEQELVTAGLLSTGDRGSYDRFRGRVMWPIRDVTGQTVGFGARRLFDDDQGPKYLNTPDTPIYHKSQVLYGLDLAKREIARGKQAVIVEGYTDVMACHLAGVTTAVATCGTAFGVDHVKVIRRVLGDHENRDTTGTGEVIFTFDPDEAGQKAASRAFAEEQRFAAQTFVAVAPDGLDPCDLRLERGDDAVRRLIAARTPMFEFMVRRQLQQHDLETVEGRVAALRSAAPVIAGIRDQALGVGYERNLAKWLGMDPGEVHRAVVAARHSSEREQRAAARAPQTDRGPARGSNGALRDGAARPDRDAMTNRAGAAPTTGSASARDSAQAHAQARAHVPAQAPTLGVTPSHRSDAAPGSASALADAAVLADERAQDRADAGYADAGYADAGYADADQHGYRSAPEAPGFGDGPSLTQLPTDPMTRLERDALMALLQLPDAVGPERAAQVVRCSFHSATLAVIRDGIAAALDRLGTPGWLAAVSDEVPRQFVTLVQQLGVAPLPGRADQLAAYGRGVAAGVVERDLVRRKAELLGALQRTDAAADPERHAQLQRDLVDVERERRALRED